MQSSPHHYAIGLTILLVACSSGAGGVAATAVTDAGIAVFDVAKKVDVGTAKDAPDIDAGADEQSAPGTDAAAAAYDPCIPCVNDDGCSNGAHCAQVQGSSYCAPDCGGPGNACGNGLGCVAVADIAGDQIQVCVPLVETCSTAGTSPPDGADAGSTADATTADDTTTGGNVGSSTLVCGDLVGPDVSACCVCGADKSCTSNGCFGGWFCNVKSCKCAKPPAPETCTPGADLDAGSSAAPDAVTAGDAGGGSCAGLDGPDVASCCKCAAGKTCNKNGCFGSYACDSQACKCVKPPAICDADAGSTVADAGAVADSGGPVSPPGTCGALDGPDIASCCKCKAGKTCPANNCFGGWYCNHDSCKCQSPPDPATCSMADAGGTDGAGGKDSGAKDAGSKDAGSKDSGSKDSGTTSGTSVPVTGGPIASLDFAIVGDTRPPAKDDLKMYPTAVITKIWQDVEAEAKPVPFAITTGDYQFSKATGNTAAPQFDLYLGAQANYTGTVFHTLGNHECTGAVDSNCGAGNKDGSPQTYLTFMDKLMKPLGQQKPWYEVDFQAVDGSWTAKFVFVAANAWSAEQAAWLDKALAKPTTYTFVVRHEGSVASQAPGVTPSAKILKLHPYTLLLVGHTHTFEYFASEREVVTGNGGAPLATGVNYGYVVVRQRPDQALEFKMFDYDTHATIKAFVVKPDGSPTK